MPFPPLAPCQESIHPSVIVSHTRSNISGLKLLSEHAFGSSFYRGPFRVLHAWVKRDPGRRLLGRPTFVSSSGRSGEGGDEGEAFCVLRNFEVYIASRRWVLLILIQSAEDF
jgi:hypothetical protein